MSYENLLEIPVLWQDDFCCSTYIETIVLLGKRSKPFFQLSNQWLIMRYLNFESKSIFFSAVSIYGLLFLQGFWRLLINCLNSKRSNFSFITAYFFTSTAFIYLFHFDLLYKFIQVRKMLLFTLKVSFLFFFHNLLFQNMLINLAEKESLHHILLNI